MKLTDKEMEVMVVLWDNARPMTAAELIEVSDKRTWRDNSIYTILNTLIKKGAMVLTDYKPTMTNNARAYVPIITFEEYMVKHIKSARDETGVRLNIPSLIEQLLEIEEG